MKYTTYSDSDLMKAITSRELVGDDRRAADAEWQRRRDFALVSMTKAREFFIRAVRVEIGGFGLSPNTTYATKLTISYEGANVSVILNPLDPASIEDCFYRYTFEKMVIDLALEYFIRKQRVTK